MRPLTIEAIRDNPWNVMRRRVPWNPDQTLVELAYLAATYCRRSEYFLMLAARTGNYVPEGDIGGWMPCNLAAESEALAREADARASELAALLDR